MTVTFDSSLIICEQTTRLKSGSDRDEATQLEVSNSFCFLAYLS